MTTQTEPGQAFRETWIAGVTANYPGTPKPSYITPWADTPEWERQAAATVERQIRDLITTTRSAALKLDPVQRGQFVAVCWAAQVFQRIENPKPAYTAGWDDLPDWQKATDTLIFDTIAKTVA